MSGKNNNLFELTGYLLLGATFFSTLAIFILLSKEFGWSLIAAAFSAGLIWGTYLVIRMCVLVSRK